MKKIAVICASPRKFNPGMFSVDLAFYYLMRRHNVEAEISYFVLAYPSDQSFLSQLPFQYKLAQENLSEIHNSDAIVLWGDFLLSQHYHADLNKRLVKKKYAASFDGAQKIINECLLLSSAPEGVLEKCFVFGSSQLLDSNNALADKSYVKLSNNLIKRAQGVWMRDIFSSLKMARIRGDGINECHGIDASLLLSNVEVSKEFSGESSKKHLTVGVFFKRTKISSAIPLRFSNDLCNQLNLDAEWVPWFHPAERRYRQGFKKHFPSLSYEADVPNISSLLCSLNNYKFIITDTYHLCLNAWKSGTPAICITNGNEFKASTLSDKKKEVFYLMNEAQDFLVDIETLSLFKQSYLPYFHSKKKEVAKNDILDKLVQSVLDEGLSKSIIKNIRDHTVSVEKSFMDKLKTRIV